MTSKILEIKNNIFQLLFISDSTNFQKTLVLLSGLWFLSRAWTPTSISSKLELIILILAFIDIKKVNHNIFITPPIVFIYLAILLHFLTFFSVYIDFPDLAKDSSDFEILLRLTFFIIIAWALRYTTKPYLFSLFLFSLSLLIIFFSNPELFNDINNAIQGNRVNLGFRNWQWASMYFSLLLILSTSVIIDQRKDYRSPSTYWILISIFSFICIIITQTRAVWVALFTIALFSIIHILLFSNTTTKRTKGVFLLVITIFFTVALITGKDRFLDRIAQEKNTIIAIYKGSENIPNSNIGVRINMWKESTEWIFERPLLGWGGDIRNKVLEEAEGISKTGIRHFHNTYIEFIIAFGLTGLAFLFMLMLYPFLKVEKNHKHIMSRYYCIFFLGIAGTFESYLFFNEGVLILAIILSPVLTESFQRGLPPNKHCCEQSL